MNDRSTLYIQDVSATLALNLIALGEIVQELVVSERTAATHISNILNKLDFSSPVQIAAWALETGLADPNPE